MLNILELLEMRKEIINGIFVIGLIYGINYFVKNLIVFTINENKQENQNEIKEDLVEGETLDECDVQLSELCSKEELDSKKEYLMNLNNKLLDIKKMLQDIKDQLHNK